MIDERMRKVLTQYRESPRLLHVIRTYLTAAYAIAAPMADLPAKMSIDSAVGDQLTLLGKRLGFPRTHCICDTSPVYGFECDDEVSLRPIVGFDALLATTEACASGLSSVTIDDDEIYRGLLRVRVRQYLARYDHATLLACMRDLFGDTAEVLHHGQGRVVLAPGRDLTTDEIALLQVYPRVLPIAPGIVTRWFFGQTDRVAGFGDGWLGFDEPVPVPDGAMIAECGGELCDTVRTATAIAIENGQNLLTEGGSVLYTERVTVAAYMQCRQSGDAMCEIDVHPYGCGEA